MTRAAEPAGDEAHDGTGVLRAGAGEQLEVQSVRRFFTRLGLRGGRGVLPAAWDAVPVDRFFLSMRRRAGGVNPARVRCSETTETLSAVFGGISWD